MIAHNSMLDPADLPRFARMGIIANCTPLWGTDYNGQYRDIYTRMLGADRVEERLFPTATWFAPGGMVTYSSDIPGVDISEGPPLIHIEALLTRQRRATPTTSRWWPASASACRTPCAATPPTAPISCGWNTGPDL